LAPFSLELREGLPGFMAGLLARHALPPGYGSVDIEGIQFDAVAAPPGALGRQKCCTASYARI
jgi:hypothetical protein